MADFECGTFPLKLFTRPKSAPQTELYRTLSVEQRAKRYEFFLLNALCRVGSQKELRKEVSAEEFRYRAHCKWEGSAPHFLPTYKIPFFSFARAKEKNQKKSTADFECGIFPLSTSPRPKSAPQTELFRTLSVG